MNTLRSGQSLACGGDLNGDEQHDIVLGVPGVFRDAGLLLLYTGS
jgi:hypothetical protein